MTDWYSIIGPDVSVFETIFRGTIMYFALLLLLHVNKRDGGEVGLADILVIVVIADAAQNGMAGTYNSLGSGIILVATIVFWDYAIDWIAYRFPAFDRLITPKLTYLIKKGRINAAGLRSEMITRHELMEQLRLNGVDDVKKVRSACVEANGKISVIKYKD